MAKLEDEEDRKNWKIDVRASLSHSALRNAAPGAEIPRSAGGDAELDRIIGRQIANLRVLRAIAKAEFSAALGIPVLTLQAVESGRFRFNPETFMRAALVLGVRPSDLFRDAAEKIALDMIVENWSLSASPPPREETAAPARPNRSRGDEMRRHDPNTRFDREPAFAGKGRDGNCGVAMNKKVLPIGATVIDHNATQVLEPGELYRLVYYSTSLLPPLDAGGEREIQVILVGAQERNRRQDVTGALTYNEFHFAQVLEGTRHAVDDVFARIRRDRRHRDIVVVEEHWIESRDFGGWAMIYVGDRNSLTVISPNMQLRDIISGADGNALALVQMMKFFLQSANPRD